MTDIAELGAAALRELGLRNSVDQELTPGMEAVIELMGLAGEGELARAKLDLIKPTLDRRVPPGRKWRIYGVMARVLGDDYRHVTASGEGLPDRFWPRLEDALFDAIGEEYSRQRVKSWLDSSPLRWSEALSLAATLNEPR